MSADEKSFKQALIKYRFVIPAKTGIQKIHKSKNGDCIRRLRRFPQILKMVIDARRKRGPSAVLVSLEDFESWQETAYLMRSPAMRRRLRRAVAQIESGKAKSRKLIR